MPIVFAENFQNDNVTSILMRYPGSTRNTAYTNPQVWPNDANTVLNCGTELPTSGFTRAEIYITFDTGAAGSSTTSVLNIFGIQISTPDEFTLSIAGSSILSATSLKTITWIHLALEQDMGPWNGWVFTSNGLKARFSITSLTWLNTATFATTPCLPTQITSITVSHNSPVGTKMSDVSYLQQELQLNHVDGYYFNNVGYVEDVDRADPADKSTYIYSDVKDSVIKYDAIDSVDYSAFYGTTERPVLANGVPGIGSWKTPKANSLELQNETIRISQPVWTSLVPGQQVINDPYVTTPWSWGTAGSVVQSQTGPFGADRVFNENRTSAGVAMLTSALPDNFGNFDFTAEFWITQVSGNNQGSTTGMCLHIGGLRCYVYHTWGETPWSTTVGARTVTNSTFAQWRFIAIVYRASTKTYDFYYHGVRQGAAQSYTFPATGKSLQMGLRLAASSYPFVARFAHWRISPQALYTGATCPIPTGPFV